MRNANALWIERLSVSNFRNYTSATLELGPGPVVLTGPNGSGKTNLLEAVSLLSPGQGLRRAAYVDLTRAGSAAPWAVAGRVHSAIGTVEIGTGLGGASEASGRIVRIDGVTQSGSGILADYVEVVWLTPSMDGLFTGPASDRRRFLDRLVLCFDPEHGRRANRYERAMQMRNRLLADGSRDGAQFDGVERVMAEDGTAIAAARAQAATVLAACSERRRLRGPDSPFPWAGIALEGRLETDLARMPALDAEDNFRAALRQGRERDRAAGRTLDGPHRTDLIVTHGPKGMPARLSSTGEQKALLLGLVLSHAEVAAERRDGQVPILLLDEVTAHLDAARRAALFQELVTLGCQAWLTGTDRDAFAGLGGGAILVVVEGGRVAVEGAL
ncbi:MAG: DNA replication/repair protein RecF [Hyphomicrobium sp.]|nr:DNA replication/repair protein RecF [Hyphomicrobium sp.]